MTVVELLDSKYFSNLVFVVFYNIPTLASVLSQLNSLHIIILISLSSILMFS